MIEYHPVEPEGLADLARFDMRQFGDTYDPKQLEELNRVLELDRFVQAVDTERAAKPIVGAAGAFSKQVIVPGGARLDATGVTWVSVAPTHTRRGIMSEMLRWVHDQGQQRGEPVAILTASESSIYERFGYGAATFTRHVRLDRHRSHFAPEHSVERLPIELVGKDQGISELWPRWQAAWAANPVGEVSRTQASLESGFRSSDDDHRFLLADDGFAAFTVKHQWDSGIAAFELDVTSFQAGSVATAKALWQSLLAVDLVTKIRGRIGIDDPLPYWLTDHRQVQTEFIWDFLWVLVVDPVAAFGARTFGADDAVVIQTPRGTWRIGSDGTTATTASPELHASHSALGPLLLGGVPPSTLARGGRITGDAAAIERADRMFTTPVRPHTTTGF